MKEKRSGVCQDILEQLETEPKLLKRVVTGQCPHQANFFQQIGDLLEQGQIFLAIQ